MSYRQDDDPDVKGMLAIANGTKDDLWQRHHEHVRDGFLDSVQAKMNLQDRKSVDALFDAVWEFLVYLVETSDLMFFRGIEHPSTMADYRSSARANFQRGDRATRLADVVSNKAAASMGDNHATNELIDAVYMRGGAVYQCRLPGCGRFGLDTRRIKDRRSAKLYCSRTHAQTAANAAMVARRSEERRKAREGTSN